MIIPVADRLKDVKAYYFVKKLDEIRQMIKEGKDVISFAIGSPDLAPSKGAIEALHDTATQPQNHGYQPYTGIPELRAQMSAWYKETYDVQLNADTEVLPLMGSKEGILHVTLAFINPGDAILVPNPGYPTYTSLSKLLGAEIHYYNLKDENNWYPDFDELEAMDTSKVKMMWVNYPHMPTGTPARLDVFEKLVAFAKERKILLCHDNPYSLVLNKNNPLSMLAVDGARDVAIEFNSLSKSHNMAGWRVGMLAGNPDYVREALRVKSNIDSGMFKGIQAAAIRAFQEADSWHDERNEVYRERREWVFKIYDLLQIDYNRDQEGLFVWGKPKPETGVTDVPTFIDNLLQKKHIFFTPGMIFGSNGDQYLRASLCVPVERIKEAYERLSS